MYGVEEVFSLLCAPNQLVCNVGSRITAEVDMARVGRDSRPDTGSFFLSLGQPRDFLVGVKLCTRFTVSLLPGLLVKSIPLHIFPRGGKAPGDLQGKKGWHLEFCPTARML